MANFDSGVKSYVHAQATVDVFFPINYKGVADICCAQCYFYRESSHRCGLNWEVSAYPSIYVGDNCPLQRVDAEENVSK